MVVQLPTHFIYFDNRDTVDYPDGGIAAFLSNGTWTFIDNHFMLNEYWRYFQYCADKESKVGYIYKDMSTEDSVILSLKGYKIEIVSLGNINDERTYR